MKTDRLRKTSKNHPNFVSLLCLTSDVGVLQDGLLEVPRVLARQIDDDGEGGVDIAGGASVEEEGGRKKGRKGNGLWNNTRYESPFFSIRNQHAGALSFYIYN